MNKIDQAQAIIDDRGYDPFATPFYVYTVDGQGAYQRQRLDTYEGVSYKVAQCRYLLIISERYKKNPKRLVIFCETPTCVKKQFQDFGEGFYLDDLFIFRNNEWSYLDESNKTLAQDILEDEFQAKFKADDSLLEMRKTIFRLQNKMYDLIEQDTQRALDQMFEGAL